MKLQWGDRVLPLPLNNAAVMASRVNHAKGKQKGDAG